MIIDDAKLKLAQDMGLLEHWEIAEYRRLPAWATDIIDRIIDAGWKK